MEEHEMGFPFEPYSIQVDFMRTLYAALEEGKVGLFESPTGTGKTLSIICSTLSWLRRFEERRHRREEREEERLDTELKAIQKEEEKSRDWVQTHHKKRGLLEEKERLKERLEVIEKKQRRSEELRKRREGRVVAVEGRGRGFAGQPKKKQRTESDLVEGQLEAFLSLGEAEDKDADLVTYESDAEDDKEEEEEDKTEEQVKPKILYCSRTHSQLTQFISEVKKTRFSKSLRLVSLGSRLNLCVNPCVSKLKNVNLVNEKCLDLQKQSSGDKKCQYMKQNILKEIRDEILADVQDIEEMASVGHQLKGCPYYGSRLAVSEAELIVIPYNILLHPQTRKSFGIDLKDCVVIVDEAHNLLETIASVHSNEVPLTQLTDCRSHLTQYLVKYNTRLNPKNLMHIKQILYFLKSIIDFISTAKEEDYKIFTTTEFSLTIGIDNINLFQLIDYCEKSQIARKLFGFAVKMVHTQKSTATEVSKEEPLTARATGTNAFLDRIKQNEAKKVGSKGKKPTKAKVKTEETKVPEAQAEVKPTSLSPLYQVIDLMRSLTNPAADGRVLVSRKPSSPGHSSIKFLLLNPSKQFEEVVTECRSLILAGGTMQPFSEFTELLFKPMGISGEKIVTFTCGHVIPENNLLPIALSSGPSSKTTLEFSFANRMKPEVLDDLARILLNVSNIISEGIVVFFSSYDYENKVYNHWLKNGFIKQFEAKGKLIFREPKKSNLVNQVLSEYSRAVRVSAGGGAFLFSVVGGKMSEGINFSDDLGRLVVMVGLPYGNLHSPELKEKMKYLDRQGQGKGTFYYENLCMKAVNQSIGRAIRHRNDYAVILLIDQRFCVRQSVKTALPSWIGGKLQVSPQFGPAFASIRQFFLRKREESATK